MKTIIESIVAYEIIKQKASNFFIDDPFDAIYISDLKPDFIPTDNITEFNKYKGIKDLSDNISFNDEWEY